MFGNLTEKLSNIFSGLRNRGHLSEADVSASLREIRVALLEADVALPVVREFINTVKEEAVGEKVLKSLKPGQVVVKIVHEALINLLKQNDAPLSLSNIPTVILLAGLQGSGKTTSAGKLAYYLQKQKAKKVLLASIDVYRPAAIKQLQVLATEVGATFLETSSQNPLDIAKEAHAKAKKEGFDVLILDTAGRLQIDDTLMDELKNVHATVKPHETLFVADAMLGQEAYSVAKSFHEAVPLTGVVLTRVDGDARGGAALSVKHVTGCPVKFMGVGEKPSALEEFDAERVANRILDMGDVVALVEKTREMVSEEEAEDLAKKFQKGRITLDDMANQLEKMGKMGGISSFLNFIPGMKKMSSMLSNSAVDDKMVKRQVGIIRSMTPHEKRDPDIIKGSRRKRIAAGAGVQISDVNRLLKQFKQMQTMLKKVKSMGMGGMLKGGLSGLFK